VPLTTDQAFVERYVNVIRPELMPVQWRSLATAFAYGEALLTRADIVVGQVVILTAGPPPEQETVSEARHLRAIMLDEGEPDLWRAYADEASAELVDLEDIPAIDSALQAAIADANRAGDGKAWLDLRWVCLVSAALLWLALFRQRQRE
jgi:hypothetical protein